MDTTHPELDLAVEDLEALDVPFSWGDFWAGVGIGAGLVALYAAGAALT
jgi:hypothetical protein